MRRLALVSLVLALATSAGTPTGAQGTHSAVSAAKRAQQTFERARRGRLPVYHGVPSSR